MGKNEFEKQTLGCPSAEQSLIQPKGVCGILKVTSANKKAITLYFIQRNF